VIIQLDRIREEPYRWEERVAVPAESLGREILSRLGEIDWSGEVARAAGAFRLTAHLRYVQTLNCTRCLKPVEEFIETDLDLLVRVRPSIPAVGEIRLQSSDLTTLSVDEPDIDTHPILIEQLQLNMPMNVLCRPDCAGLCPRCGADRNENPSCCEPETDPRWEALKDLMSGGR
jgi:uncharacterized protein